MLNRQKFKEKEVISFDQLHINAVHQRFVSADEMKFLILVDQLFIKRIATSEQINEFKQALTRTIQAEFPHYSLPGLSRHKRKLAELRQLFRLQDFRTHFTQDDFERERNKARKKQSFPAENIQTRKRPFDLFEQDLIKQGCWTSRADVGQLWKQMPEDKRSEYEEKSKKVKQEIAEFEQTKLPKLLKDPKQFYWLLRVASTIVEVQTYYFRLRRQGNSLQ